ncbi:DUF6114 domain-containing protein [Desmospora profundinema]|uniref:Uncharacterized protein n=1 Tax=Desmospora profundinema TaxID=1571184 RepID=A0ABU1IP28_9BACL|nr:DUF6114 domain-containing protein [Desmospora profundinema]MDR6226542.1 hypothetical protein [Desmospora profundinema]
MAEQAVTRETTAAGAQKRTTAARRPRAALILVILSGVFTLYIPVQLYWLAFVPGSFAFIGLLFGGLILACGVIGWWIPQYVRLLGGFTIVLSLLSLIGALGGMLIGMLLGLVGGALCIAWDRVLEMDKGAGRDR